MPTSKSFIHFAGSPKCDAVWLKIAGTPIRAVMLDRLGPNVWHRSPREASAVLEELEETARLWLMTRPEPLTPAQIEELRHHFSASW